MKIRTLAISLTVISLALFSPASAECQNDSSDQGYKSGLIYGVDHVFALKAPSGWVLDNTSGVEQGLHAVFYPKGSSWGESKVVMYANAIHKEKSGLKTLKGVIDDDVNGFRRHAQGGEVKDEPALLTRRKIQVTVKYFHDEANSSFDEVAYIDESEVVVILALSARSRKEYEDSLAAFRELVGSYFFVSDKVTIAPKQ